MASQTELVNIPERAAGGDRAIFASNRAEGRVSVVLAATAGRTRRIMSREDGSLRVRFPSACAGTREAVLVNTAGGIAGGDRFSVDLDLGRGSRLTVTTAAAEKVYRSLGPAARLDVAVRLEEDAELIWLPRETILFDQARFERRVDIALAPTAKLAFAETVIFGRAAMGETVGQGRFLEHWRIRRDGRLIFAENFCFDGAVARTLRHAAVAGGKLALGTLLLVPGDDAMVAAARAAAVACRGEFGMSAWNGIALARLAAADGAALRHDLILVLHALGRTAPPRLWLN